MVHFFTLLFAFSVAGSVTSAAPNRFHKRIAQVIPDSTKKWEAACDAANGGAQCNQVAVKAFGTLLAGAGTCDQQNNADIMMTLSKQLNSPQMISLTQIFVQQPRNSPNSVSIPYCQQAPQNQELAGLFQCQFQGVDLNKFVGGIQVGAPGTIPFGQNAPVNPPGSCPAHTSGPVPAGEQLTDLVQSPGVPGGTGTGSGNTGNGTAQDPSTPPPASGTGTGNGNTGNGTAQDPSTPPPASGSAALATPPPASGSPTPTIPSAGSPTPTPAPLGATNSSASASGTGFKAQNGRDAQALNQKFQSLTPDSPCTDGENACVTGQFAQCTGGKFSLTPCTSGLVCTALPLVNSPGTSVTCDTQADASARFAAALGSG